MAYREDVDLEFLSRATHEELKMIADLLIYDPKNGKTRWTEELKSKLQYCTDYRIAWQEIAGELQCFGANTLSTMFRFGKGVTYREILCDCCDILKVNYNKKFSVSAIENHYLEKVLEKTWEKMTPQQQEEFLKSANAIARNQHVKEATTFSGLINLMGLSGYIGFLLARTILFGPIICSAVALPSIIGASTLATAGMIGNFAGKAALAGTGLSTAGKSILAAAPILEGGAALGGTASVIGTTLGRGISMATPLGWALNAYTLYQISGPASRVTIPVCVIIAYLRKKYELSSQDLALYTKYDQLCKMLQEKVATQEDFEKKLLGGYAFGRKIISLSANTLDFSALDFVLFGAILDTIKQTVVSQYANLPQTDSLSETAEYAIKNLNCDIEMLAAIKDYLLINSADELIRQKIEGEFAKIQL